MSEKLIDAAGKVRVGEEVDLVRVTAYLRAAGWTWRVSRNSSSSRAGPRT